jgi:hypothetical protein
VHQPPRQRDVVRARSGIAGRMIVDSQDCKQYWQSC